jgi:D-glycero-alpha-D-manno-heptose 1-phosphate guanylyltransferase
MNQKSLRQMLILAGGLGTRVKSLVLEEPKPMFPVNGKPFLAYLIDYLINQGINLIGISIGYKSEFIKNYFGNNYNNTKIFYIEELELLGTGGAIKKAINECKSCWEEDNLVIVNGDTWFEISLQKFLDDSEINKNPMTIAVKYLEHNNRYGSVKIDHNSVIKEFNNLPVNNSFINAGCYLVNKEFFINYLKDLPEKFSFEEVVLKDLANRRAISASIQNVNFIDIGIPEDYKKVNAIINKN